MRVFTCSGSPYEIGLNHGQQAKDEVHGSLAFYKTLFLKKSSMSWEDACAFAKKFVPFLETLTPDYIVEMKGVAEGAGVRFEDILALNVRTEIAFGMYQSDGCTSFSWKKGKESFLSQNWDWEREQAQNLIALRIVQGNGNPTLQMVTEGGIIGKIGLNEHGIAVTLNAIQAAGVNFKKLPCHLALRCLLDSKSLEKGIEKVTEFGVASSCHILTADSRGSRGIEFSAFDHIFLPMGDHVVRDIDGVITHTNHYLHDHKLEDNDRLGVNIDIPNSKFRLARIRQLIASRHEEGWGPSVLSIQTLLSDEEGHPGSICRDEETLATLFSIVMNLTKKQATVTIGRPVEPQGEIQFTFT